MKINQKNNITEQKMDMEGAKDVTLRILIGKDDGSDNIIMRLFKVSPGGHTPLHSHDFEHVVKVEKGKGVAVDGDGNEHEISMGSSVFVPPNETHQFRNPYDEDLELICVIRG